MALFSMKARAGIIALVIAAVFSQSPLHAQIAGDFDKALQSQAVTWLQAVQFVLPASGVLPEGSDPAGAFALARENGWIPSGTTPEGTVKLKDLSLLIMKSFQLKGGIFYTIFPNSRYAYREMLYNKLIQGRSDPNMTVPGDYFFYILGRVLDYAGEEESEAEKAWRQSRGAGVSRLRVQDSSAAQG
jgi:hypothetical protein